MEEGEKRPKNPDSIFSILYKICPKAFENRFNSIGDWFDASQHLLRDGYACHLNASKIILSETRAMEAQKNTVVTGELMTKRLLEYIVGCVDRKGCGQCFMHLELPTMRNSIENVCNDIPKAFLHTPEEEEVNYEDYLEEEEEEAEEEGTKMKTPKKPQHMINGSCWPKYEQLRFRSLTSNKPLWRQLNCYVYDSMMKGIDATTFDPFKRYMETKKKAPRDELFEQYMEESGHEDFGDLEGKILNKTIVIDGGIHADQVDSNRDPVYLSAMMDFSTRDNPVKKSPITKKYKPLTSPCIADATMASIYNSLKDLERDHIIMEKCTPSTLLMLLTTSRFRRNAEEFQNKVMIRFDESVITGSGDNKKNKTAEKKGYSFINVNALWSGIMIYMLGRTKCPSVKIIETLVFLFLLRGCDDYLMEGYCGDGISRWDILEQYIAMDEESQENMIQLIHPHRITVNDIGESVKTLHVKPSLDILDRLTDDLLNKGTKTKATKGHCGSNSLDKRRYDSLWSRSMLEVHMRNIQFLLFYWTNTIYTRSQNTEFLLDFDCSTVLQGDRRHPMWGYCRMGPNCVVISSTVDTLANV